MADMLGIRDADCVDDLVTVAWHKKLLGWIDCNATRFEWASPEYAEVFRSIEPGDVPATLLNLRTEGWLNRELGSPTPAEEREDGVRRSGNFAVASTKNVAGFLNNLPEDVLKTSLTDYINRQGTFTGKYEGPDGTSLMDHFQDEMADSAVQRLTPRMSGQQMKLAMTLHDDGTLTPATYTSSTHILKPSGGPEKNRDVLAAAEWMGLELAEAAGSSVEKRALIEMPHGLPPALLVERFDIPTPETAGRDLMINQDFCSAARIPPEYKYGIDPGVRFGPDSGYEKLQSRSYSLEGCGKIIRKMSTDPQADSEELLRRAVTAWLMLDSDLHLKNISFLKHFDDDAKKLTSVRLSPVYDAVSSVPFKFLWENTRTIPGGQRGPSVQIKRPSMALPLNGRKDDLKERDFLQFAKTLGISQIRASEIIRDTATRIQERAIEIAAAPPEVLAKHQPSLDALRTIADFVVTQVAALSATPAHVPEKALFATQTQPLAALPA